VEDPFQIVDLAQAIPMMSLCRRARSVTGIAVMNQIHGHEVMKMMLGSGKTYTKASLTDEIVRCFGANARFYTCSAENLSPAELVDFLEAKGKFVPSKEGGFNTSADLMCQH